MIDQVGTTSLDGWRINMHNYYYSIVPWAAVVDLACRQGLDEHEERRMRLER
jgi:hypothetical protein